MKQLIRTYSITGAHEITVTGYTFTKQDIRSIINETLAANASSSAELLSAILVSSTKKSNVSSVSNGVITLVNTTAALTSGDDLTIEIDIEGGDLNAKAVAEYFGLPDALPEYETPDPSEIITELEDVIGAMESNPNLLPTYVDMPETYQNQEGVRRYYDDGTDEFIPNE